MTNSDRQELAVLEQMSRKVCPTCEGDQAIPNTKFDTILVNQPWPENAFMPCPNCEGTGHKWPGLEKILRRCVQAKQGCVVWTGATNGKGYGLLRVGNQRRVVHRVAWEILNGAVPEGLQLDHLCRNRLCVNPAHLEAVTSQVNILRGVGISAAEAKKTHCPQGHPYGGENLYISSRGYRQCRTCLRAYKKKYRAQAKAEGRPQQ